MTRTHTRGRAGRDPVLRKCERYAHTPFSEGVIRGSTRTINWVVRFLQCGAVGTALLLWTGLALARPWPVRAPSREPKPAHQLRNLATWPAEPPVPAEIDAD